jgi:hypothetical protein
MLKSLWPCGHATVRNKKTPTVPAPRLLSFLTSPAYTPWKKDSVIGAPPNLPKHEGKMIEDQRGDQETGGPVNTKKSVRWVSLPAVVGSTNYRGWQLSIWPLPASKRKGGLNRSS